MDALRRPRLCAASCARAGCRRITQSRAGPLASPRASGASGAQARRFKRAIEQRMWPGFFVNWPGCGRHGSMNGGRDPRQQAVGRREVIRDRVLHGFGGVVEVAAATLVVVVSLVLPVQLEMRKVGDSTRHRPGAGQCQRLPKHGHQQDNHESGAAHGASLVGERCPVPRHTGQVRGVSRTDCRAEMSRAIGGSAGLVQRTPQRVWRETRQGQS